jgi:phage gp46-like protein
MNIETFIKLFANKKIKHREYNTTNGWWVLDKVVGSKLWGTDVTYSIGTYWPVLS